MFKITILKVYFQKVAKYIKFWKVAKKVAKNKSSQSNIFVRIKYEK